VGYGGSGIPQDIRAVIHMAREAGVGSQVMQAVDRANECQKDVLPRMILDRLGVACRGKTVAVWGLAFKPETDDIRESPALALIDHLLIAGVSVRVADPRAIPNVRAVYGRQLTYCAHRYEALEGADALAIVTDWEEYRASDFMLMKMLMRQPILFDGRNMLDEARAIRCGFEYQGIGRHTGAPRGPEMVGMSGETEEPTIGTESFDPSRITSQASVLAAVEWSRGLQASA
jgi:UDPglucose 6-dehydrogenase